MNPDESIPATPVRLGRKLITTLARDRDRLLRIDRYLNGEHDDPYMPDLADDEYRLLAKRSVSNWCPLLVGTPAQALYVDNFRRGITTGSTTEAPTTITPEWRHWQKSGLDARQAAVHRGALTYGHSFTLTEKTKRGVRTKGLSALKTVALYEDPANDQVPAAALTVTRWPATDGDKVIPGQARMWDGRHEYTVTFDSLDDEKSVKVSGRKAHGASECPITRFAAAVDLEGRTVGVIEPVISVQDRINQTIMDLLLAQSYAAVAVRTVTGMAPPMQMEPEHDNPDDPEEITGYRPKLDANGNPMPQRINHNARRFLFAEDPDVKWGSLDATPLGGFIDSLDMSIRHLSALSQTPPHHLLGQIANLSAEALLAAETALSRKVEEFRKMFGESWERVFRLAAELEGELDAAEDYAGEVIWRDMELKSLAQSADGLGKLAELLGIPKRGLWNRVPGTTKQELDEWDRLYEEENSDVALANALTRASGDTRTFRTNPRQEAADELHDLAIA